MKRILLIAAMFVVIFPKGAYAIRLSDIEDQEAQITSPDINTRSNWDKYNEKPFKTVRAWFHIHTDADKKMGYSDGDKTVPEIFEMAQEYGYQAVFFNDHADTISGVRIMDEYAHAVSRYSNKTGILGFAGREITVAKEIGESPCHINAYSDIDPFSQYLYSSEYAEEDFEKVLDILRGEQSIVIYNHPRDCEKWQDKGQYFDGIELFNDVAPWQYKKQRNLYLKYIAENSWRGFVISGTDLHYYYQEEVATGMHVTYIFPDEITHSSVMKAMREGRTIGTRDLTLLSINHYPSKKFVPIDGSFTIEGSVSAPESTILVGNLYKNGLFYKKINIDDSKKARQFSFSETLGADESSCYVFEIDSYMLTSPYCFENKSSSNLSYTPPKACKVRGPYENKANGYFTWEGCGDKEDGKRIGMISEFCVPNINEVDNIVINNSGTVIGCSETMFVGQNDQDNHRSTYFQHPFLNSDGNATQKAISVTNQKGAWDIVLGTEDYRIVMGKNGIDQLISGGSNVKVGEHFFLCNPFDPRYSFTSDHVSDCNTTADFIVTQEMNSHRYILKQVGGEVPAGTNYAIAIK